MSGRYWTPEETEILIANYPNTTHAEIAKMFPYRSELSIYKKAYSLGLVRTDEKKWETHSDAMKSKGGKVFKTGTDKGYTLIHMPEHDRADKRGFVFEHIVVAEAKYGRKICKEEAVHHINGIKSDNRPENLIVFRTSGEHTAFHNKRRKVSDETKRKISEKAKERYQFPSQHPSYKFVDIQSMANEVRSGVSVKDVCRKYGIHKSTYYSKLKGEGCACL